MRQFVDLDGRSWDVALDGFSLGELRDKGVDIVQDGLFYIEQREDVLLKALAILCREQITKHQLSDRAFARGIAGVAIEQAFEAVRGAAEDFFPPKRWSEIQSRSEKRKDADQTFQDFAPMLELLNRPQMPPAMRQAVLDAVASKLEEGTSSASSP